MADEETAACQLADEEEFVQQRTRATDVLIWGRAR
jgi:hypothetical protein